MNSRLLLPLLLLAAGPVDADSLTVALPEIRARRLTMPLQIDGM